MLAIEQCVNIQLCGFVLRYILTQKCILYKIHQLKKFHKTNSFYSKTNCLSSCNFNGLSNDVYVYIGVDLRIFCWVKRDYVASVF